LVPDARVLLADGSTALARDLRQGTLVRTWTEDGKVGSAKVTAVRRQNADTFLLVKAADRELRATGSHRVALAGGKLVRIDTVKVGDRVWIAGPSGPVEAPITQVRVFPSTLVAYDLTIDGHRLFAADGVVVGD